MPAPPPVRATRRGLLTTSAAVGSLALGATGCDLAQEPTGPAAGGSPTPAATAAPGGRPQEDGDELLVARVADDIAGTLALVTAAGRGRRRLRRAFGDLERTHRAHLDALPVTPDDARRVRVTGDDRAALRRVRAAEQQLQRRLVEAAVDARSGALAALLASMSAAVAQRLASGALA